MILRFRFLLFAILLSVSVHAYRLKAYIPTENPTQSGIIVCPGGSYFWLDKKTEGEQVAQWLCENGIAAFVLEYSHGGWGAYAYHIRTRGRSFPAGFHDLCNALDSVRNHANDFGIRTDRIGFMGFSAGGHLSMSAACFYDNEANRPAFAAPIYPVVTMNEPYAHDRSRRALLGDRRCKKLTMRDSLSLERHVPDDCPPVFLVNCVDDDVVDYHNSVMLDSALTVKNINHRYIQYQTGGHGFGASETRGTEESRNWKNEFINWIQNLKI